jgi:signal transduction histidine kinase
MKISFTLDQDEGIDPNDPIGDIVITNAQTRLSVESTYLDSWFDVLIDGYKSLQNKNKITLEIVEEPDVITFETVLNGFKVSYGKQKLFFSDLNEFYQSLLTSAKELLFQLDQSQENLSIFPLLIKIYNFVENCLDLTQISEKSSQFLHCESVNIQELILSSWERLEPLAQEKKVILNYQSEDSEPILINGDRDRLMQVFLNLFDNSLKYSPTQAVVRVIVQQKQGLLQIQIIDQGSGFNLADLPHIFDRLYRGDPSRTRQGLTPSRQGSGLGLAIAKEIIHAHGGSIQAENDHQTGGACLTLSFSLQLENLSF